MNMTKWKERDSFTLNYLKYMIYISISSKNFSKLSNAVFTHEYQLTILV